MSDRDSFYRSLNDIRYYLGKFKVRVVARVLNKSYCLILEKGKIGNKKIGYREVKNGDVVFLYTRNCYKKKRD